MAYPLKKKISRKSEHDSIRDGGKPRQVVITIYPGNINNGATIGLRLSKTRREEFISIETAYYYAVKLRVFKARMEKGKAKAVKKKRGW